MWWLPGSCHEVSGADAPSRDFVAQQTLSQAWCAVGVVYCFGPQVMFWQSSSCCDFNCEAYELKCCHCTGRTLSFLCSFVRSSSVCEFLALTVKAAIDVGISIPCWSFLDEEGGQCEIWLCRETTSMSWNW